MNHGQKCATVIVDHSDSNPYHTDFQSIIDSYVTSVEPLTPGLKDHPLAMTNSSLITFNRDPAVSEHLTDEIRWFLIQYGPHQPRDDEEQFLAGSKSTQTQKGIVRFRAKWFDDVRFSDWLEYSLTTSRAYCFYCRLFADSNRNRAFSRNGKWNILVFSPYACSHPSFRHQKLAQMFGISWPEEATSDENDFQRWVGDTPLSTTRTSRIPCSVGVA